MDENLSELIRFTLLIVQRFEMFCVRVHDPIPRDTAASRACDSSEEKVLPLRQVQLRHPRQGALHEARQVPLHAHDQVRPMRVPHTLQMEPRSVCIQYIHIPIHS